MTYMKKALITGISGQDGYFLSKSLLEKGYEVHGILRRDSQKDIGTLKHLEQNDKITLHWGDITDSIFIDNTIKEIKPDELYHLAAQSFVDLSFINPKNTYDINIGGTLNIVNAVKEYSPTTRVYFAATSELYGQIKETPQTEETPFYPRTPYGISKLAGFWIIKNYRERYNLFMANGILFNHESEHRGSEFVTRKITLSIANILKGKQERIELGNLEAKRDWGYAKEYVEAMWLILQQDRPDDFVISTGETHTIKEFVEEAFKVAGIDIIWEGTGIDEIGIDNKSKKVLVKVNPKYFRPAEVDLLIGDCSKAKTQLNWKRKVDFKQLVRIMVDYDMKNS